MTDDEFDALLAETFAPPRRGPDRAFVARIGAAVAEAERFRAWRRRALRRLGSEALVLLALAGAAATLARDPGVAEALAASPFAIPAAVGALFIAWLALSPQRGTAIGG